MKKNEKIKAVEFDNAFEEGDITKHLNLTTSKVHYPVQRVNIDIPQPILDRVDQEASRIGVPRNSLLKLWISERIDRMAG